jgi:hypothetical protein
MYHREGPPDIVFVHEWWVELKDDLRLAGALFVCPAGRYGSAAADLLSQALACAETELLDAHTAHRLPQVPQGIIYGLWYDAADRAAPAIGPILADEWLSFLGHATVGSDRTGLVQVVRVSRISDDRSGDPMPP